MLNALAGQNKAEMRQNKGKDRGLTGQTGETRAGTDGRTVIERARAGGSGSPRGYERLHEQAVAGGGGALPRRCGPLP